MLNILVLAGGNSPEREVSLRSGAAVAAALQQAGHSVTTHDPAEAISQDIYQQYDAIFPALHGIGGEDGILQDELESYGLHNFVGSDAAASRLCFDKNAYKSAVSGTATLAPGALVSDASIRDNPLSQQPFVIKPYDGGSSVDTFIVRNPEQADWPAIHDALNRYGEMLLESLIDGVEITVGILGNQPLPVIEIIPPQDGEFDYENKYNGATQELCPPQNVSTDTQKQAQALALQIHQLCGCRDMSRTDMIVTPAGELYVLETNTIPGMTDQSLLPKAAATAGIAMPDLCARLVQAAAARR